MNLACLAQFYSRSARHRMQPHGASYMPVRQLRTYHLSPECRLVDLASRDLHYVHSLSAFFAASAHCLDLHGGRLSWDSSFENRTTNEVRFASVRRQRCTLFWRMRIRGGMLWGWEMRVREQSWRSKTWLIRRTLTFVTFTDRMWHW